MISGQCILKKLSLIFFNHYKGEKHTPSIFIVVILHFYSDTISSEMLIINIVHVISKLITQTHVPVKCSCLMATFLHMVDYMGQATSKGNEAK